MKNRMFIVTGIFLVLMVPLLFGYDPPQGSEGYFRVIGDYLNMREYWGNEVKYTEKDLTVPHTVDRALEAVGVSMYTLLRNEMFARHGYRFKTPILAYIYSLADWYKEDSKADLTYLSSLEASNVNFIKAIEDNYDYENVAEWLDEKGYFGDDELYTAEYYYEVPQDVQLSMNHLAINSARLLRNEVFARRGYIFKDAELDKIFSLTSWYRKRLANIQEITSEMGKLEFVNVELLRKREWLNILDSVIFSVPEDVVYIPAIGYNAIFIKKLRYRGEMYYYSSQFVWPVLEAKKDIFDDHRTDAGSLVSAEIVRHITLERDPFKKLVYYFDNKKYEGYTDTVIFNHSDMEVPDYLEEAVRAYGVDWHILLRKEIHARNGARFIDKKVGSIFKACGWFKERYGLTPATISRFPANVKLTGAELTNFALLEGEELYRKYEKHRDRQIVVDLNGNVYFVKTGWVSITPVTRFQIGHSFDTLEEYNSGSLQDVILDLIDNYRFDLNDYIEKEGLYMAVGC